MSVVPETTIRVPIDLRDSIRAEAAARRIRQADLLRLALRELEQAEFFRSVAATAWEGEAEAVSWEEADLVAALDPWEPTR